MLVATLVDTLATVSGETSPKRASWTAAQQRQPGLSFFLFEIQQLMFVLSGLAQSELDSKTALKFLVLNSRDMKDLTRCFLQDPMHIILSNSLQGTIIS